MANSRPSSATDYPLNIKLGIVGGGNMAKALIMPLIEKRILNPDGVIVSARRDSSLIPWREAGCATTTENIRVTSRSEVILWAVKPQFFAEAVPQGWNFFDEYQYLYESTLHISIMAGTTIATILETLRRNRKDKIARTFELRTIRCMPNMASQVACGIVVYALGPDTPEEDACLLRQLFEPTGVVHSVKENQINAYTALMGCGTGFMMPIIEAMSDGAVSLGIPRDISLELAAQVMKGAGELVLKTKRHPAVLKDSVCSPGGSTIAGVMAMEENNVRKGMIAAVLASNLKGEKLAQLK